MNTINEYFRIFDELEEGVYFMDPLRTITYWNKGAEQISGWSAKEVIGRSCRDNILVHVGENGKSLCADACPAVESFQKGQKMSARVYLHHKLGHRVPIQVTTLPFRDAKGQVIGVFELFSDRSIRRIDRETLHEYIKHSYIDEHTGLFNKRYFRLKMASIFLEMSEREYRIGIFGVTLNDLYDVRKSRGNASAAAYEQMIIGTLRSALNNDRAMLFSWQDNQVLALVPDSFNNAMMRSSIDIKNMMEQSFIMHGNEKKVPDIGLKWLFIDRETSVPELEELIETLFLPDSE